MELALFKTDTKVKPTLSYAMGMHIFSQSVRSPSFNDPKPNKLITIDKFIIVLLKRYKKHLP